jgi:rhodanese-related sulfurtransferase
MAAGLLLHTQIDTVIARLQDFGAASAIVIAALLVAYVLFKYQQRRRFYRLLRMARITVDELHQQMDRRPPPIVVDVRSRSARERDGRRIPGALTVDVEDIDSFVAQLSPEREIVLYCTCPNEASAARIAKLLIERGFTRVRPLLGGFDAWIDAGFLAEDLPGIIAVRGTASAEPDSEEQRKVESI